MPLAFFAPLFLAGAALIAIPWIIHHIRRPEREPLKFSSLMFIPKVTREVIERRRIQHLLLMLLRMIVLVALALAFARPYWRDAAKPGGAEGPAFHVIAIDGSFSMAVPGVAEKARQLALGVLNDLGPTDRAGLIVFAGTPVEKVAISEDADQGDPRERIREAINEFEPGQDLTAMIPALRLAQEQLISATQAATEKADAPRPRATIHLVSDFQKAGLPKGNPGWRLSPRVQLHCLDAGTDEIQNDAVTGVSVRRGGDGQLRIQARVRNGSATSERTIETRLYSGEKILETAHPQVKAMSTTQVAFTVPTEGLKRIEGRIEIAGDPLEPDNTRYFAWSEETKRRIVCIAEAESEGGWPGWLFLERAIPHTESDAWIWERRTAAELNEVLKSGAAKPDVIILSEPTKPDDATVARLVEYASAGGKLWVMLRPAPTEGGDEIAKLASGLGLRVVETKEKPTSYSLLSWIDFEHPVFAPLQGERFNDFSQVRFADFLRLSPAKESNARVFARFEGEDEQNEPAAMLEVSQGEGTAIVWSFSPDPALTNFARTIKFVPVVMETLNYLTGAGGAQVEWFTAQRYARPVAPPTADSSWRVQLPGRDVQTLSPEELAAWKPPMLEAAGFFRAGPAESEEWRVVEAVNVHPEESNLERMTVEDFRLKLAAIDDGEAAWVAGATEAEKEAAGYLVRHEFSRWFLGALLALLALECWYASRVLR